MDFEEFKQKKSFTCDKVVSSDSLGYYFIQADIIQEGSMDDEEIIGIFIPRNVDKKKVADALRKLWGPATKLLKK